MLGPFVLAGVGISMAIPAAQNSVVGSIAAAQVGKAAGANSMMRELGGVFGIALAVAVFAGAGGYVSPHDFIAGFGPGDLGRGGNRPCRSRVWSAVCPPGGAVAPGGLAGIKMIEPEEA